MKKYQFVEPHEWLLETSDLLSKGLGRSLTELELRKIKWLSEDDYETKGVFLDLFKELVERQEL